MSARGRIVRGAGGLLALLIGILDGLVGPNFSEAVGPSPSVQVQAAKEPASQAEEARWLAVRYAVEAEYHFFEAIRYEERAIQIDPLKDSSGTTRNTLLSEANSHWTRMLDLRTRAQLSRIESSQRSR
jgi:hypothetical protein